MVNRIIAIFLLAVLPLAAQVAEPAAGIPREIAETRVALISDLHYDLGLAVPRLAGVPIAGDMTMRFQLKDASKPLVVDFAPGAQYVGAVTTNGVRGHRWINGHIVIPAASLRVGANAVNIRFTAGDASLNRTPDFLYALFVPARAHLAIPCFDQPSLKARWKLALQVPGGANWQVVANGELKEKARIVTSVGEVAPTPGQAPDWWEYRFAETQPLPTYLFSFAVGDFMVETAERNGRTFHMYHRETDSAKVARNRDAIFDLHARALAFMEQYTGIPYAFGKFDFVLVPAFQFGGMEHAGEIFYNASGLMLDESASQNQYLGRASVIAHETAHMWFGDLVTMAWFNDVWMKEVFANFMAAKIVNPSFPEVNHELRFLLAHYPSAYDVDRTSGANPIRQPLENLNEAGSLYGAIIYQKAPIVMRHLEGLMGEEAFRDGLREYLKNHAFGNATWPDLIEVLDRRTPADLKAWSKVWVGEPGRPTVATQLKVRDGRIETLSFQQSDSRQRGFLWPQDLRVTLGYKDRIELINVPLEGANAEAKAVRGKPEPLFVLPNGGGWAYGDFTLDASSLSYLAKSLPEVNDPLTRGAAWVALWESMLDRALPATQLVDLAMVALPKENDEQLTARVLGYLRSAWWQFLSPGERASRQMTLEVMLGEGLTRAATASQKSAWFSTLRDVARGEEVVAWLHAVWEQKENVPGLPLAEADYATLAQELAVREVPGWSELLQTQLARMKNPDRKGQFAFVLPALSADPAERERWFQSLADVSNRRHEPWVLTGLNYLHHPLRANASEKYVLPSLKMLPEIQRTGDIFFPTRWVNATLSERNSRSVADEVRAYLDGLPADYPPRLRAIILQGADDLFRSAR